MEKVPKTLLLPSKFYLSSGSSDPLSELTIHSEDTIKWFPLEIQPPEAVDEPLQNGLVGSPCSPRDSQESSLIPQFKIINSSVLSFLHSPTLTSIHDHKKNHSLD